MNKFQSEKVTIRNTQRRSNGVVFIQVEQPDSVRLTTNIEEEIKASLAPWIQVAVEIASDA